MTQPSGMPHNPGDPVNTDPEATSADRAEAAAEEAKAAQDAQADASNEAEVDPTLDAGLTEEALPETPDVEAELAERTEDLQRLNAEYTNYRRRTERERQAIVENAKAKIVGEFLPVLDDIELARQHGDLEEGPFKSVADKVTKILQSQNLQPFGEEGDPFNPEIHEAVQDLSTGGEQVVGTVLRRGYRVGDKLVRNAMVIIADPAQADTAE
ncbi:nucleotide exchange factor GrpE [Corynebacterium flavescens]|uniref:nucleotide exchange factor GrpE n=1 Tax=Corynebacterium flavescens TaxID=28028 RepID=UPI00289D53A8|nr:nucleotide exchange factor GrpE [Corynebacterium flavescens]